MDQYNLIHLIALITIFISFLLSFFLLTVKTKNRLANVLLASFIILCSIDISKLLIVQYINLFILWKSFTFLIFPTFFLYVLSICRKNFRVKFEHLLHTSLFILYNLTLTVYFLNDLPLHYLLKTEWFFGIILLKSQALFYIIAIILVLRRHRKIYLENFAANDIYIYKWLYYIILILSISLPLTIAKDILHFNNFQVFFTWVSSTLVLIALVMICWFVLKALYNPELFRRTDFELQTSKKLSQQQKIKIYTKLEIEQNSEIVCQIEQIREYMNKQEPYLESALTLHDLASQLNIPLRELSILINQNIGENFFDFVNKYRIKKATEVLKNSTNNLATIKEIMYDSGFNSKSSFNTAFKKHTGLTPTQYRIKHS